jgi:hypothetical protein
MISPYDLSRRIKFKETESKRVAPRGWRKREWEIIIIEWMQNFCSD